MGMVWPERHPYILPHQKRPWSSTLLNPMPVPLRTALPEQFPGDDSRLFTPSFVRHPKNPSRHYDAVVLHHTTVVAPSGCCLSISVPWLQWKTHK